MRYRRTPIEIESPEQLGYSTIRNNLAESSFSDMCLADYGVEADLGHVLLQYGDHLGAERLRRLIVGDGGPLSPDHVLVTAGAASALFIIATSLLGPKAHALICAPNYATNLETPRAIGADVETVELRFDDGWRLDLENLASRLRQETLLVSVTYPHNPTGSTITRGELEALVALVESHPTARLLVDETYRELAYGEPLPMATSLSPRVLAVSSMSKTYGLPGLRVGWLTCRDEQLMETLLAAKEQIFICGAVLEEELAARVLEQRAAALQLIQAKTQRHLALVRDWIDGHEHFEWVEPTAGVVGFPCIRPEIDIDIDRFYRALLEEHGTYVGPGRWFDQDPRFFRLGFAWPTREELERGLEGLDRAAAGARSTA
jgi:aspartate/methionine/tyrosine aminotransferase